MENTIAVEVIPQNFSKEDMRIARLGQCDPKNMDEFIWSNLKNA